MLIYVHIPFCVQKCKYCDFASFSDKGDFVAPYFDAMRFELEKKAARYGVERVSSIYFGGGTPTAVPTKYLVATLEKIRSLFDVSSDAEITLEANPKTFDGEKLRLLRLAGFNRISVGVQSFFDDDLKKLGRIHDGETARRAVALAKERFDNVSLDLLIGIENQTEARLKKNLDEAFRLNVSHISAYMLMVESGTPLQKLVLEKKYRPVSDDDAGALYDFAARYLKENGYDRYEVSNFAKLGAFSRHNLGYWRLENYVGVGLSAHSLIAPRRFYNTSDISQYIKTPDDELFEETLSPSDFEKEYIMLSLRQKSGIDLLRYERLFSESFSGKYKKQLAKLEKVLDITETSVAIKDEYFAVGNAVTTEFM